MQQELTTKCLIALLTDGKSLESHYTTALDLFMREKKWSIPSYRSLEIESLRQHKNLDLALRVLLLAHRLQDAVLIERAKRISVRLSLASTKKAENALQAYLGENLSKVSALHEYFTPPKFIQVIHEKIDPHAKKSVAHISPLHYRHPEDIEATSQLDRTYPFQGLARLLSKEIAEKAFAIRNSANAIRVGPDQFPALHKTYVRVAQRLGIKKTPPLYLARGPINAYTSGVEEPFVVLQEGAVSQLTPGELEFVIGHELGHIKFDHVLYHMIARLAMAQGLLMTPNIVLGRLLSSGMQMAIMEWSKKAELSCDRAGLLGCQDSAAAYRLMLRFAGAPANQLDEINIDAFIDQYETYEKASSGYIGRMFDGINQSHPWLIKRIQHLRQWISSGEYDALLAHAPDEISDMTTKGSSPKQSTSLKRLTEQLRLGKIEARWIETLEGKQNPIFWSIGERHRETARIQKTVEEKAGLKGFSTELHNNKSVLPHDTVIYSLNCNALLSSQEKTDLMRLSGIPNLQLAVVVWGMDHIDDDEERQELEQRLLGFIAPLQLTVLHAEQTAAIVEWCQSAYANAGSSVETLNYVFSQLITEADTIASEIASNDIKSAHKKALAAAQESLQEGFASLQNNYKEWFSEMTIEERRHEGAKKLVTGCEQIIQKAGEIYWANLPIEARPISFPDLDLAKRNPQISNKLIAAGIGSLAFGTIIIPAAPIWLMLSGLGVGVASMTAGQVELKKQAESTAQGHFDQVDEWLLDCQEQAMQTFEIAGNELLESIQQAQQKGWKATLSDAQAELSP